MSQRITRFDNGLRLVTERMDGILSATIGIYVARGSRHELQDQCGIAHFLEHMAFKGTKSRSALDIVEAIENRGGYMNAFTSKEMTAYYTRMLGEDVPMAMEILTDVILNSSFDGKEIETERGVILQEIGMYNDTPDEIIFDWLTEACYPDQAIGRPILGRPDDVRAYKADDFREFIAHNYGPENLVIVAAGHVDHDALEKQIRESLIHVSYQSSHEKQLPEFQSGQMRVEKALEQAHIAMAMPAPSLHDDDFYTAQILANILGGGMSSRLFQNIREQRGLCYSIFASHHGMGDHGQFMIYAGTSADGIDELMEQTALELKRFSSTLREEELQRSKVQMRAGSVMALENVSSRVNRMANQMIYFDKLIDIQDSLAKIDAITIDDIAKMADAYLTQTPQMVLYGPIAKARDLDGYQSLLS